MSPDEARSAARAAPIGPWFVAGDVVSRDVDIAADPYGFLNVETGTWERVSQFIATFDPEFVSKLIDLWEAARIIDNSPAGKRYGFLPLTNALDALKEGPVVSTQAKAVPPPSGQH